MRFTIPLLLIAANTVYGQAVSVGVKAGVPLTKANPHQASGDAQIDTGRWTVGPTIEVRLVRGFSLEFDALYRAYSAATAYTFGGPNSSLLFYSDRVETKAWDLPLLVKYRFKAPVLRPFVTGGYSVTHETSDATRLISCLSGPGECGTVIPRASLDTPSTFQDSRFRRGPVVGAGVEFEFWKMKIAPEIRYSRIDNPNTNQATLLVGFTF